HTGLAGDAPLWPQLLELAESHEQLGQQAEAVTRHRQATPDAVAAVVARLLVSMDRKGSDAAPAESTWPSTDQSFEGRTIAAAQAFHQIQARLDEALTELAARTEASREQFARLNTEQNALAPLAEAKAGRRWWTRAWWRATLRGNILAEAADLQTRVRTAQEKLAELEGETARLLAE